MTSYAHGGPAWVEIVGPFTITEGPHAGAAGADWPEKATPEERAAAGVAAIVNGDDTPPEGEVFAGWAAPLVDVAGVPTREATFAPAPRRLIEKSVVQERVNDLGLLDNVLALLLSPGHGIYYARWFAPDWPRVYFDDPGLLTILAAVGCTEEQVAAITAP